MMAKLKEQKMVQTEARPPKYTTEKSDLDYLG